MLVWGEQFTPNSVVLIYAVTYPYTVQDGDYLPSVATFIDYGYTDEDGNLIPFEIPNRTRTAAST